MMEFLKIISILPMFGLAILGFNSFYLILFRHFSNKESEHRYTRFAIDEPAMYNELSNYLFCPRDCLDFIIDEITEIKSESDNTRIYTVQINTPTTGVQHKYLSAPYQFNDLFAYLQSYHFNLNFIHKGRVENIETIFTIKCESFHKVKILPSKDVVDFIAKARVQEVIHNQQKWEAKKIGHAEPKVQGYERF